MRSILAYESSLNTAKQAGLNPEIIQGKFIRFIHTEKFRFRLQHLNNEILNRFSTHFCDVSVAVANVHCERTLKAYSHWVILIAVATALFLWSLPSMLIFAMLLISQKYSISVAIAMANAQWQRTLRYQGSIFCRLIVQKLKKSNFFLYSLVLTIIQSSSHMATSHLRPNFIVFY